MVKNKEVKHYNYCVFLLRSVLSVWKTMGYNATSENNHWWEAISWIKPLVRERFQRLNSIITVFFCYDVFWSREKPLVIMQKHQKNHWWEAISWIKPLVRERISAWNLIFIVLFCYELGTIGETSWKTIVFPPPTTGSGVGGLWTRPYIYIYIYIYMALCRLTPRLEPGAWNYIFLQARFGIDLDPFWDKCGIVLGSLWGQIGSVLV